MSINLMPAICNQVPGFPLDGGRILRAILRHCTGSFSKSRRVAADSGQFAWYGIMAAWIWAGFVTGSWLSGLWMALIGCFLINSPQETVFQVCTLQPLEPRRSAKPA